MRAILLYGLASSCVALGLGVSWVQAENYARADALQRLERRNLDLEVLIRAHDAQLTEILREIEAGVGQPGEPQENASELGAVDLEGVQ
ncbi:MAG: hypothetical protein AAFZ65_10045 [Planctomycetota bacterium]